ncbi:MAG: hypothetical protein AAF518_12700, partial [Spirochaetota bacterium]
ILLNVRFEVKHDKFFIEKYMCRKENCCKSDLKECLAMKEVFYEEEDCIVYWDSSNNWIYTDWRNIPKVETVKKGCAEILTLLQQKSCSKILNDNQNVTGAWSGAAKWVAEEWFPLAIQSGLQKFAWIQSPHSALSQMNASHSEREDENDVIKLFLDAKEAENWLKS